MGDKLICGTYLQKMSKQYTKADGLPGERVQALCLDTRGRLWVGTEGGPSVLSGGKWKIFGKDSGLPSLDIRALTPGPGSGVTAATGKGISIYHERGGWNSIPIPKPGLDSGPVALAADNNDGLWLATNSRLFFLASGHKKFQRIECPVLGARRAMITDLASGADGVLWISSTIGLARLDHGKWDVFDDDNPESGFLYYQVGGVALDGKGNVFAASRLGLIIYDGIETWSRIAGRDGMPVEAVGKVAIGDDGWRWFGSSLGAICLQGNRWEYFAGRRWLPDDQVLALLPLPNGEAWIGTAGGLAQIRRVPMTLEQKSNHCHKMMDKYFKRWGFTTELDLKRPGDMSDTVKEATDNDGLWTSIYLGAECFRWAVTGDKKARKNAKESMNAVLDLERLSTIDGYMARALVRKGEKGVRKSGGVWYPTADGKWEWKADTSSDEITGHFFVYPLYFDLVADAGERREIIAVTRRIADHFLANDFNLVDKYTGRKTTWGVFAPRLINNRGWEWQRGLNSLELLAVLKVCHYIAGDPAYEEAYLKIARDCHYALNTLDQKITIPGRINHSDDALAFMSYYPLLVHEKDPDLRALYRMSLDRSWAVERTERNPLWNIIFGVLSGEPCDIEGAVMTLRELPLDPVAWDMRNSHRKDLNYRGIRVPPNELESRDVLPYDELPLMRWNGNPFRLDGGCGGMRATELSHYLLPYWMGRYHGLIIEEKDIKQQF